MKRIKSEDRCTSLHKVVRKVLFDKVIFGQRPKEGRKQVTLLSEERTFQYTVHRPWGGGMPGIFNQQQEGPVCWSTGSWGGKQSQITQAISRIYRFINE